MKKILLLLAFTFILSGCTLFASKATPTAAVENFLGKYQSLNQAVMNQLDDVVANQGLTANQSDEYKRLMKNQYQNLTYTVKKEQIKSEEATVSAVVEVFNLGKQQTTVDAYVETNPTEFKDEEGTFSKVKYMDYKIEQLKKVDDRVKYNINFKLTQVDNKWVLETISDTDRQKINGVYSNV